MNILARKYVTNGDKSNGWFTTMEEALEFLGQTEDKIRQRVNWLNYTDIFFRDTNDYLRIKL
jgi:hypothetical protein